jgi:RNA polymerase sigma-70 factor (ECF subfamily)
MATEIDSDESIARKVQGGDSEAFGTLVVRYEEKLLRYGRRFLSTAEDIEDAVQDVFIRAYQNIQSFDTSQRFSPWIYRIAHNSFVNVLRSHTRQPYTLFAFDSFVPHFAYETEQQSGFEKEEITQMLEKNLKNLSPKYREVLVLHYFEDMAYKDIADVLSIPIGTVGIRMKRAKEALKKSYRDEK